MIHCSFVPVFVIFVDLNFLKKLHFVLFTFKKLKNKMLKVLKSTFYICCCELWKLLQQTLVESKTCLRENKSSGIFIMIARNILYYRHCLQGQYENLHFFFTFTFVSLWEEKKIYCIMHRAFSNKSPTQRWEFSYLTHIRLLKVKTTLVNSSLFKSGFYCNTTKKNLIAV